MRNCFPRLARMAPLALVLAVGLASPVAGSTVSDQLREAQSLIDQGQAFAAERLLSDLMRADLSASDRQALLALRAQTDQRLKEMTDTDRALHKADYFLSVGDVIGVEQAADEVRKSDRARPEDRLRASTLMDAAARMRADLTPAIPMALDRAMADLKAGRFAEAKAGVNGVQKLGARMTQPQRAALNEIRDAVIKEERRTGKTFTVTGASPLLTMAGARSGGLPAIDVTIAEDEQDQEYWRTTELNESSASQPASSEPPAPATQAFDQMVRQNAERMLTEASQAYAEGRYERARELYQVLQTQYARAMNGDEAQLVDRRLTEINQRLGQPGGDLLGAETEQIRIGRERTTAQFNNFVEQARAALAAGQFAEAKQAAANAEVIMLNGFNQGFFSQEELDARKAEAGALLREINAAEEQARVAEITTDAERIRIEQEEQARIQSLEKERKLDENIRRMRDLQMEQKYREALQVCEELLFIDPTNPTALMMKPVYEDILFYREWEIIQRQRAMSYTRESLETDRALIAPEAVMDYPSDWPELTWLRTGAVGYAASEADRRTQARLAQSTVQDQMPRTTLEQAIGVVASIANVNYDIDWVSLREIGVSRDDPIELHIKGVSAQVMLDRILDKVSRDDMDRAGYTVKDGILLVGSEDALDRHVVPAVYNIRDMLFDTPNFDSVPEVDLNEVIARSNAGQPDASLWTLDRGSDARGMEYDQESMIDKIVDTIQTSVSPDSWRDRGGSTGTITELNGSLVISTTPENHAAINGLLSELREVRNIQISVEARFLTVSQDFFEQIGFDLDLYFNARNNQFQAAQNQLDQLLGGSFFSGGLGLYPSDLVGTRTGQVQQYFLDPATGLPVFATNNFSVVAPEPLSIIPVQQGSDVITNQLISAASDFAAGITAGNPALSAALTFMDDVQVDLLIEATQADQRTVNLTAPRLTFTNGHTANVFVTNQRPFVSDLTPVVGTSSVAFDPTVNTVNSGFTLLVRGVVSADRRYVTLATIASLAVLEGFGQDIEVEAAVGGTGGTQGTAAATGAIQTPLLQVARVQTAVTVPDKGTILLGGQRVSSETEVETGVPVLSKLPFINRFFTNRAEVKEEQTLLILLKPTIIIQSEEENKRFPGLNDDISSYGG